MSTSSQGRDTCHSVCLCPSLCRFLARNMPAGPVVEGLLLTHFSPFPQGHSTCCSPCPHPSPCGPPPSPFDALHPFPSLCPNPTPSLLLKSGFWRREKKNLTPLKSFIYENKLILSK
ncbi:unnamed protein product [Rangifer tarandus platyrhynchus]|uniref:Uncharacterized protein n=1 Tax=Rangifer tarandus platyrhynchus TaxID=3082113 RepID=A0AC59ZQZ7_RANTA